MIAPDGALIGEMLSETWTVTSVLAQSHGFVILDRLAAADLAQDVAHLGPPLGRDDEIDVLADRFRRGESEQAFGGRIPAGDRAIERFRDDGVMGRFDRGAEQTLALGEAIAGGLGAAMFADFVLELDGFCIGFADHPGEGARQHAGLAGCVDRNGGRAVAARRLRPPRSIARSGGSAIAPSAPPGPPRTTPRPGRPSTEVFWIVAAVAMITSFGAVLITATHSIAGQHGGRKRDSARPSVLIRPGFG